MADGQRVHGPGAAASNAARPGLCTRCGRTVLFEVYIDPDTQVVTQQATDSNGLLVCDDCYTEDSDEESETR